jgi:hypothetical protein
MRVAAALLAAEPGRSSLASIAAAAGFESAPLTLEAQARQALGLGDETIDASVSGGGGALRALLIRTRVGPRDGLAALAQRLARRTPQLLWLVVAEDEVAEQRVLATWVADRASPRIAALVVDRARVVDSDAEALCAIAAARNDSDTLTHARWIEILGREGLSKRFYRVLAAIVGDAADALPAQIPAADRSALALLATSRLLFLAFLEAKGWLDGDREFIGNRFVAAMGNGSGIHRHVIEPLFFGTLNTRPSKRASAARAFGRVPYLNGGLFTRSPLERQWRDAHFPDETLMPIVDELLSRYRLTTREQAVGWSEAAVDPEMLGRAFETLMASRARRVSGAFYTPQTIVAEATSEALASYLQSSGIGEDGARAVVGNGAADATTMQRAGDMLGTLRLVDPACGSGAFLVHALERVAELRGRCGAPGGTSALRRDTLARCIFGVDSNPTAVWLCELRLWLAAVIDEDCDDPLAVRPLPNLDHNIRVGDSLAGGAFAAVARGDGVQIEGLRLRYARATGRRKASLARELERAERRVAIRQVDQAIATATRRRRDLLVAARARDLFGACRPVPRPMLDELRRTLRTLREERQAMLRGAMPFAWSAAFPDIGTRGGFDVAIGNPPWVRLHNIPPRARERLRREFAVFRLASWDAGAEGAGAGRGFAAQVDLAALFVERATQLVRPGGTMALLLPAKLWRSLAGGGVRKLLLRRAPPLLLDDWSESAAAFDAAVYPSLLVARVGTDAPSSVACALRHRQEVLRWTLPRARLPLDDTDGSPWVLAPGAVRAAFEVVRDHGVPMAASLFGRPRLGIKCGCNDAFVIDDDGADIEPDLLRPLVRGETLRPWHARSSERLLWTHDDTGAPLASLPPRAARHLARFRRTLAARTDARDTTRWWGVFRVDGALPGAPRVVWADVGRVPRAAYLDASDPTLVLNSCYVARCPTPDDARALAALLNSPLVAAWLALLAEPARGGYRRFLGWTMALLPIPRDWPRARALLAPVGRHAIDGEAPSPAELLALATRAYRVRPADIAPLVEWTHR